MASRAHQLIGRRLLHFDRVESTNTIAAAQATDPANDGLAVWAEEQTAGRGRMGRTWHSPPGCGVWLSVLLLPPESLRRPVLMTALAAVAVCETIREVANLQPQIKWPNDVLVHGRKVCGILVEQGRGTVLGIGLNVNTPAEVFSDAKLEFAGSLAMFTSAPLDRKQVVDCLLGHLDSGYADLRGEKLDNLESLWRQHTSLLGRQVVVTVNEGIVRGRLVEFGFGTIVVQDGDGSLHAWPPEAIVTLAASVTS